MNDLLKIYSSIPSERQIFVFDLVFEQLLGIGYEIVSDKDSAQIEYSNSTITSVIHIPICNNLLSSKGFEPFEIPFKNTGAETILFPSTNSTSEQWDFDLFSAVFYLVSRYEEYSGFEPDVHNRFPPEASILFKTKSFEFPLVNIWVEKLRLNILKHWPETKFKLPEFRFISTIDVDSTFQYSEKGIGWSLSGVLKDAMKGDFKSITSRLKTIARINKDAYDVFDYLKNLHHELKTEVKYFFLLGDYAPYDKNISWKNKRQSEIIKKLSEEYAVGAHPSYLSNTLPGQIKKELQRLETITGQKPTISRQHFLMHSFPSTYQNLVKNGIKEDYTLGYTSQYGFRAGIASPFYFFDLEKDESTYLLLYPFCSMDITPLHYYKLTPEQAMAKNKALLQSVKSVNGTFISLWHNESISGTGRWQGGWPDVYAQLLKDGV